MPKPSLDGEHSPHAQIEVFLARLGIRESAGGNVGAGLTRSPSPQSLGEKVVVGVEVLR